ncbi:metallophosphoesterase family protein [Sphingomonas sp. ID0503]|uniref:metallophosphoesterase family protein n=1 Tax=Sphingomonas sp. ID0503 TaxID=3399691 RepID=UPI003AFA172E
MHVGIVSDIHGQVRALEAALEAMGPIDRLICLGDSIQQAAFSNETVALLRAMDALTILGNHEEAFFAGAGRTSPSVDEKLAEWLATRPTEIACEMDERRVLIVHSTPWPSAHAYVPPGHRDFHRFEEAVADVILYGHTHQPVVTRLGERLIVNPGSTGEGRPTDAGFVRSCAVLDLATLSAEVIDLD